MENQIFIYIIYIYKTISCYNIEALSAFATCPTCTSFVWVTGNELYNNLLCIRIGKTSNYVYNPPPLSCWISPPTSPYSHLPSWTTAHFSFFNFLLLFQYIYTYIIINIPAAPWSCKTKMRDDTVNLHLNCVSQIQRRWSVLCQMTLYILVHLHMADKLPLPTPVYMNKGFRLYFSSMCPSNMCRM